VGVSAIASDASFVPVMTERPPHPAMHSNVATTDLLPAKQRRFD
jgi:hypothetical protein